MHHTLFTPGSAYGSRKCTLLSGEQEKIPIVVSVAEALETINPHIHSGDPRLSPFYPASNNLQPLHVAKMENTIATPPQSSAVPSCEDWDTYREIITDLYIGQNKSLPRVEQHMISVYGFRAT